MTGTLAFKARLLITQRQHALRLKKLINTSVSFGSPIQTDLTHFSSLWGSFQDFPFSHIRFASINIDNAVFFYLYGALLCVEIEENQSGVHLLVNLSGCSVVILECKNPAAKSCNRWSVNGALWNGVGREWGGGNDIFWPGIQWNSHAGLFFF